jgi:hypothetical protein
MMKRSLLLSFCFAFLSAQSGFAFQGITQDLQKEMETRRDDSLIRVNIILKEKADFQKLAIATKGVPKKIRRPMIWNEIQQVANRSQASLRNYLKNKEKEGKVSDIRILWTANGISAQVVKSVIPEIWNRFPEVRSIDWDEIRPFEEVADYKIRNSEFARIGQLPAADTSWGVKKINAPQVWAMGYTGAGIIVGNIDTGVNYNHVDLADHLWDGGIPYPNHGWDFASNDNDPMDQSGHGTRTAGIVCGDGTAGFLTGVAPDATLMCLRASGSGSSESTIWQAMDFCIANGADIITSSLSWKYPWSPDYETWRDQTSAELLAGIVHSNSIGNQGNQQGTHPIPYNIATPGNCPPAWLHPDQILIGGLSSTMGCGAVDPSDQIMDYSGRGPAAWETGPTYTDYPYNGGAQMALLKPDVSAPTNVETVGFPGDSSYSMSFGGTSAATPHLGGALALLLSADTTLTPGDVTQIIQMSAVDLGAPGKDNEYGAGRIDIYQAILSLLQSNITLVDFSINDSTGDNDMRAEPGETVDLLITLQNGLAYQDASGVSAILRTDDSTLTLIDTLSNFGPILAGDSTDNLSNPYTFFVNPSSPHWATFTLEISATPPSMTTTETFQMLIGHPPILLVDDDDGANYEDYFRAALDNLSLAYEEWNVVTSGDLGPALLPFDCVIWFTGDDDTTTLTSQDQTDLTTYLDGGGNLAITGQNIGEDIGSDLFYINYLHALYDAPVAPENLLEGVSGDPIGDGLNLITTGSGGAGNQSSQDVIIPIGGASPVFNYTPTETAAIRYDSGTYKIVYYAFGLEGINKISSYAGRDTVFARTLGWFGCALGVGIEETDSGELRNPITEFHLYQSKPNPFHQSTTISYQIPSTSHISLSVYDLSGKLVETLVDQVRKPGVYSVKWEGKNQSSGVYFYRLTGSGFSSTKKLILLK